MNKFPGKVELVRCGMTRKLILNDEQKTWLIKHFPAIENRRLAEIMGISEYKLHCFAREMGLQKSKKGLEKIMRRRAKKAAMTNERNGCYDRKRGKPVSDATIEGRKRRFEEERLGIRENPQKRIRREEPEKYKAWAEKRSVERKKSIEKEKTRIIYNLERKTKLRQVVLCPYKRSQVAHRYNAIQRGYILTEDCREGNPDRYMIYYDKQTERSRKFEENCRKDGFRFEEWKC